MQVAFWGTAEQLAGLQTHSVFKIVEVASEALFFDTPASFYFIGKTFSQPIPQHVAILTIAHIFSQPTPNMAIASNWPNTLTKTVWELKGNTSQFANLLPPQIKILAITPTAGYPSNVVISMIINEAYFALQDGVSTKPEIDLALQLGAGYPFGPFEWAQKIGVQNVITTLTQQAQTQKKYTPCALLLTEI
jgi:3-hydroxybutyryl-CoA dehydrogenase